MAVKVVSFMEIRAVRLTSTLLMVVLMWIMLLVLLMWMILLTLLMLMLLLLLLVLLMLMLMLMLLRIMLLLMLLLLLLLLLVVVVVSVLLLVLLLLILALVGMLLLMALRPLSTAAAANKVHERKTPWLTLLWLPLPMDGNIDLADAAETREHFSQIWLVAKFVTQATHKEPSNIPRTAFVGASHIPPVVSFTFQP